MKHEQVKCLNDLERLEVITWNKNGHLPSPVVPSHCQNSQKYSQLKEEVSNSEKQYKQSSLSIFSSCS